MCQVKGDCSDLLEKPSDSRIPQKCMKCKEVSAVVIIRVGDAFCRSCFEEFFVHKFRAILGKNRVIFPGEKVLLAVSGGPASCCMLRQVQQGLHRDAPKKLRFVPGIVYIDEGGVCGQSDEQRKLAGAQLEALFLKTGLPYHIVSLEQVFSLTSSVLKPGYVCEKSKSSYKAAVNEHNQNELKKRSVGQDTEKSLTSVHALGLLNPAYTQDHKVELEKLFLSIKTQTAKEDMLHTLRQHLILHVARENGYSKVMMGESCTRLAIKLLSNISLGRGGALAADTAFSDSRYGDVAVVRPMRDYSVKEIAFYNRLFDVSSVFIPGLDTKTSDKASIQRLTESFVVKLQADFPSTVSTVYRTSEKLNTACPPSSITTELDANCLLCLCALDTNAGEASAFHATVVSENLSQGIQQKELKNHTSLTCCEEQTSSCGAADCCSTIRFPILTDLRSLLCYSCRQNIKDMTMLDSVPSYIMREAEERHRRVAMRHQISEFLLEEDEQ